MKNDEKQLKRRLLEEVYFEAQKLGQFGKCAHAVKSCGTLILKLQGTVKSISLPPISWGSGEGGDPVGHHGRVPPLEQYTKSRPSVADSLSLLLPIVPC